MPETPELTGWELSGFAGRLDMQRCQRVPIEVEGVDATVVPFAGLADGRLSAQVGTQLHNEGVGLLIRVAKWPLAAITLHRSHTVRP